MMRYNRIQQIDFYSLVYFFSSSAISHPHVSYIHYLSIHSIRFIHIFCFCVHHPHIPYASQSLYSVLIDIIIMKVKTKRESEEKRQKNHIMIIKMSVCEKDAGKQIANRARSHRLIFRFIILRYDYDDDY